jgi:hypothetical protein
MCDRPGVREWLDLGPQALTNRFLRSADEPDYLHPCRVGVCRSCGTVQLESPVPVDEMRPRFDWITYNEPEGHLDDLAQVIVRLPGVTPDSSVGGVTYKDESTLKRLNKLGCPRTWLARMREDLGVESPLGGIESVQDRLTVPTAEQLAARYGKPDVLLVRHVLEHAYDIHELLRSVRALVRPGGYAVFEMPDARRALERLDYSTVWEEHLFYFTPVTLRQCFAAVGFEVVSLESYFYTLENSLVAIVRPAAGPYALPATPAELDQDLARADRFVREFPRVRHDYQQRLRTFARTQGKVAMLGAGHLSGAFINLYGLEGVIDFVADDNPKKHGLFMPGSKAPIRPSSELVARDVKLCLMTVRPEIEDLVVGKNRAFTDCGGRLASVFPDSKYSLDKIGRPTGSAA